MTSEEKRLLEQLQDFVYIQNRIDDIMTALAEVSYKVTATYSLTAGVSNGRVESKVEGDAIRNLALLADLARYTKQKRLLEDAVNKANLTARERALIECIMNGYTLSQYARRHGLYKSYVYKIRDKALKKMVNCMENHTF